MLLRRRPEAKSESEQAVETVEQNRPATIIGETNNPVEATRCMVR